MNDSEIMTLIMVPFFTLILPMAFIFGIPIAKRMQRRMELKDRPADDTTQLELEQVKQRLAELEERLDFAERLLARGRESEARLPGGTP